MLLQPQVFEQSLFLFPPQTLFRNVWADHADLLSLQYAGTPALKTDFTRTGKRTARGMVGDLRSNIDFPAKFCIF